MSDWGFLPLDIIIDILSRLPVKSLCRFKSVSPPWNSLISTPYFAKAHLNRTKTKNPKNLDQKIVIISTPRNLYSVDLADHNLTITTLLHFSLARIKAMSSCNGLLLVSLVDNSNFLCNPSTREHKVLPPCPFALVPFRGVFREVYGVGYDSSNDDYKVVKIIYSETGSSAKCSFTAGAVYSRQTNAWGKIQINTNYVFLWTNFCGVFFSGCLHFLCWKKTGGFVILAFNLSDEIFREVLLPTSFGGLEIFYCSVAVCGDCLCLTYQCDGKIETVWMMKEYGVRESWTELPIDVLEMYKPELVHLSIKDGYLFKASRKMQDRVDGDQPVVYNFKNETLGGMVVDGLPTGFMFESNFVESLVSPYYRREIGT